MVAKPLFLFKVLTSKLTGFRTSFFSISWQPLETERNQKESSLFVSRRTLIRRGIPALVGAGSLIAANALVEKSVPFASAFSDALKKGNPAPPPDLTATAVSLQAANDTHQAALDAHQKAADDHQAANDTHQAALDTHQWYWMSQIPPYLTALGITVASVGSFFTWLWSRIQAVTKEMDTQVHNLVSDLESNPDTRVATAASLEKYVHIKKGRYAPEIYTTVTSILQTPLSEEHKNALTPPSEEHKNALTTLQTDAQNQVDKSSRIKRP